MGGLGSYATGQDKNKVAVGLCVFHLLLTELKKLILFSFSVKFLLTIFHFIFLVELADIARYVYRAFKNFCSIYNSEFK